MIQLYCYNLRYFHFLAFNPKTNTFIRQKYKKELVNFEDQCTLIEHLSLNMKSGYKERPVQFDEQMERFMDLKKDEN